MARSSGYCSLTQLCNYVTILSYRRRRLTCNMLLLSSFLCITGAFHTVVLPDQHKKGVLVNSCCSPVVIHTSQIKPAQRCISVCLHTASRRCVTPVWLVTGVCYSGTHSLTYIYMFDSVTISIAGLETHQQQINFVPPFHLHTYTQAIDLQWRYSPTLKQTVWKGRSTSTCSWLSCTN